MKIKTIMILVVSIFILTACETTPKVVEEDPNFIGNFDPIQLENLICVRESLGGIVPTEIRLYFIPRTNNVEMYLRDGMTTYVLILGEEERQQLFDGVYMYADSYAAYSDGDDASLVNRDATRKNSFNTGTMSVSWGVVSTSRNNTTVFYTNYKFLEEDRPYFELLVDKTKDKENASVYSPVLRLYFSPTHLEKMLDLLGQENLEQMIAELEAEAFAF